MNTKGAQRQFGGIPQSGSPTGGPDFRTTGSPTAPDGFRVPLSHPAPSFPWMHERATKLARKFRAIEAARARGVPVNTSLRKLAQSSKGRTYRNSPGRVVRFSFGTCRRLFYAWRKHGERALQLRYHSITPKRAARFMPDFVMQCGLRGVGSFTEAWRQAREAALQLGEIQRPADYPGRDAFRRAMPRSQRQVVSEVYKAEARLRRARRLLTRHQQSERGNPEQIGQGAPREDL